ncbi:MAG: sulfatase-like hydrolase/transferase [Candidatus Hydrogenedens sp.]|nr:sulfatase-like hydrolase/transferase [Candidatus Hydrogenedens sp.]
MSLILQSFLSILLILVLNESGIPKKNILFLTIDTLRADHLGCYGYNLPTSNNIDALAKRGLIFDNCIAEVPLTCPSFSSMLTSQYPRYLGVTRNGLGISDDNKTVQEILKEHGYFTFCVQSNWTLKSRLSNLNQGFDIYDDDFHNKRWGIFSSERIADEVTRRAIQILNNCPQDKPFFAWVHYSDPHAPYHFRKEYNPGSKLQNDETKIGKVIKSYDSEIRFTDEHIGKLLMHLPKNTSIIFVADHGESLYEHNYLGHGRKLYQNEIRIPFFIVDDEVIPGRTSIPVRGIDVGPTILGIAKIEKPKYMLGKDILNEEIPVNRVRVIETYGGAVPKIPILRFFMKNSKPIMQSVIDNNWKLIVSGIQKELYNLKDDPKELNNLVLKEPEIVINVQKVIKEWSRKIPKTNPKTSNKISDEDMEVLRSMGYLE